jgi:hypothetical protein
MSSQDIPPNQGEKITGTWTSKQGVEIDNIQMTISALTRGDQEALNELADFIACLLHDLKTEAPAAAVTIKQLKAFLEEVFKQSQTYKAALEFYRLEHSGQIIGGNSSLDGISEAIKRATQREPKAAPLNPSQAIPLNICDDFTITLIGNSGDEVCALSYQVAGSDGEPQLQFRTPGGDMLAMTDLDVEPMRREMMAEDERECDESEQADAEMAEETQRRG